MLDNTFYLYCRFKGNDAGGYYKNNQNYLLGVKVGMFKKRVKIGNVHGYENRVHANSERRYENQAQFEQSWKVIKDVTHEA